MNCEEARIFRKIINSRANGEMGKIYNRIKQTILDKECTAIFARAGFEYENDSLYIQLTNADVAKLIKEGYYVKPITLGDGSQRYIVSGW